MSSHHRLLDRLELIAGGEEAEDVVGRIAIPGRKTHLLAAGRSSPLEIFRAAVGTPGPIPTSNASVRHIDHRDRWWNYQSVTGGLLVLDSRADLRLKIEARLQQPFDRTLQLSWTLSCCAAFRIELAESG